MPARPREIRRIALSNLFAVNKGASALRKLHKWAKEGGEFQKSDVSLIFWVTQDIERRKRPSAGNVRKVKQLWEKATRKGFLGK